MKIKIDDVGKYIFRKLYKLGKAKDDNTIEIKKPKMIIKGIVKEGSIIEMDIKTDKDGEKLIKKIRDEIDYVEEKDIEGTGITIEDLKTGDYDNLFYNRKEFIKRKKALEKLAVIEVNKSLPDGFVNKEITITFNPKITKTIGDEKTTDIDNEFGKFDKSYLPIKDTEKDIDFLDKGGKMVGRYFRSRNTIVIFAKVWKETNNIIDFLKDKMKVAKIKIEDIENFKLVSLAKVFTRDIGKRVSDKENNIKRQQNELENYQTSIIDRISNIEMDREEINALKGMKSNFKGNFFKEIREAKNMPFIEDVELTATEVKVKYKPTCITISNFVSNGTASGFGKRSMYIGSVTLRICAKDIRVSNDLKLIQYKTEGDPSSGIADEHPHPHAHKAGDCCLGGGEMKNTFFSLKNQCKIADLASYFWLFVKNYGKDGGYMAPHYLYNFCLMNGYPVFDEKGKQISINDEARLKSKEQIKLKKAKCWESNIKEFKSFVPY